MFQGLTTSKLTIEVLYANNLCHRCNMKSPSVRYCHEMYGTTFVQYYGWYINQTYFRLGIFPSPLSITYLSDVCPDNLQIDIEAAKQAEERYHEEEKQIFEASKKYLKLRREASQLRRRFTTKIENITRVEFGFRKVGEGWVSETLLYKLITRLFPSNSIVRHSHPDWLERLEL